MVRIVNFLSFMVSFSFILSVTNLLPYLVMAELPQVSTRLNRFCLSGRLMPNSSGECAAAGIV